METSRRSRTECSSDSSGSSGCVSAAEWLVALALCFFHCFTAGPDSMALRLKKDFCKCQLATHALCSSSPLPAHCPQRSRASTSFPPNDGSGLRKTRSSNPREPYSGGLKALHASYVSTELALLPRSCWSLHNGGWPLHTASWSLHDRRWSLQALQGFWCCLLTSGLALQQTLGLILLLEGALNLGSNILLPRREGALDDN